MDAFPPAAEPQYGPPCPGCGRARTEADARSVAWSSQHTANGVTFICPACTRAEIALVEAGLPSLRPGRPAA